MSAEKENRPTEFELEVLKVLWERGPSTAREVLENLPVGRSVGYTTVLKMLQLMEPKKMVGVDRSARSHVYRALLRKKSTLRRLSREFVDRAFDGAVEEALIHLVDARSLDAEALRRIEKRLSELKAKERRKSDG